jgi:Protein of unknown function (DUF2283)
MSEITCYPVANAAYVTLSAAAVNNSAEGAPGLVLDFDAQAALPASNSSPRAAVALAATARKHSGSDNG